MVRYTGHTQTIITGSFRRRVKPGDILELDDPELILRDKLGRRLWEAVEP